MKRRKSVAAATLESHVLVGEEGVSQLLRLWELARALGVHEQLKEMRRQRQLGRRGSRCLEALQR